MLLMAAWRIGSDCREEVEVAGMPNNQGLVYVDYVLFAPDGRPLAMVETKRTSVDPKVGKIQS
jgi:type I restriction enzyme R subunit